MAGHGVPARTAKEGAAVVDCARSREKVTICTASSGLPSLPLRDDHIDPRENSCLSTAPGSSRDQNRVPPYQQAESFARAVTSRTARLIT
jgi:hypothetical protein